MLQTSANKVLFEFSRDMPRQKTAYLSQMRLKLGPIALDKLREGEEEIIDLDDALE